MYQDTKLELAFAAREFAVKHHGDQKYGEAPYVSHLDHVATLCLLHEPTLGVYAPSGDGFNRFRFLIVDCLVVAFLHDVVEDTDVTADQVRTIFGDLAAECVASLSDPPGKSRKERKAALHAHLSGLHEGTAHGAVTLAVKKMDRLANLQQCVKDENHGLLDMYKKEHAEFRKAVHRGHQDQAWSEIDRICR